MPRPPGAQVFELAVPEAGLILNTSPHKVPPNAVLDGQNVYIDVDGYLKPRPGYEPLDATQPGGRIMGGISYKDSDDATTRIVVANLTEWWTLPPGPAVQVTWDNWVASGDTWDTITPTYATWNDIALTSSFPGWQDITGTPNNGSAENQARFVQFAMLGFIYIFGVNGTDPMRTWKSGDLTYTTVASAPVGAKDICTIANRLMVVNLPGFPYQVRWSAINDGTTWPGTALNNLIDTDEPLVGIRTFGRLTAAIYGEKSIWLAVGQAGGDSTAFQFQQIPAIVIGPAGPAAIVEAEGIHYYFGRDLRVHRFNGVQCDAVSMQVDKLMAAEVNVTALSRIHGTFISRIRSIVWWYPPSTSVEPTEAILFNIDTLSVMPLWKFIETISTSFGASAEFSTVDWTNWVSATATWDDIPYATWDDVPGNARPLFANIGTGDGDVHQLGGTPLDDGETIPYGWTTALFRSDPSMVSLPDRINFFWQKSTISEVVKFQTNRLEHPTSEPALLEAAQVDVSHDDEFEFIFDRGNVSKGAFLQLVFDGISEAGVVAYGGAELYFFPQSRTTQQTSGS